MFSIGLYTIPNYVQYRVVHNTKLDLLVHHEPQYCAYLRVAADEVGCPINRVNDPRLLLRQLTLLSSCHALLSDEPENPNNDDPLPTSNIYMVSGYFSLSPPISIFSTS